MYSRPVYTPGYVKNITKGATINSIFTTPSKQTELLYTLSKYGFQDYAA